MMNDEMKTTQELIDECNEFVQKLNEIFAALAEAIAKFVKAFCNTILLFALKAMNPKAKLSLKSKAYQSVLRRKLALRSLTLQFK